MARMIGRSEGWLIALIFVIFYISIAQCLECHSCDVTSDTSIDAANGECNSKGTRPCADQMYKSCMFETYHPDGKYRVHKYCIKDCPVFINNTAVTVRCCGTDGCNGDIASEVPSVSVTSTDPSSATTPSPCLQTMFILIVTTKIVLLFHSSCFNSKRVVK